MSLLRRRREDTGQTLEALQALLVEVDVLVKGLVHRTRQTPPICFGLFLQDGIDYLVAGMVRRIFRDMRSSSYLVVRKLILC